MKVKLNLLVLSVSLVEGMAGSMRVKNLIEPLINSQKITVSNLPFSHINERHKIGLRGILDNGIKYLYIGYTNPFNIPTVFKFYKNGFKFIKSNYTHAESNILYVYGYPDIKNFPFIIISKLFGFKIVFDIVEDNKLIGTHFNILGWLRNRSSLLLTNTIPLVANCVICISSHLTSKMEKLCSPKIPVIYIPITVNFKYFPNTEWVPNPTSIKIFYGGSYNTEKDGIDILVNTFKNVARENPGIQLVLTGMSNSRNEMIKIENLINKHPQIKFLGYLSSNDYFDVLNSCDIFCMPRNSSKMANAGFPFKLGEYLATGKVTISSVVGDVEKYLKNNYNAILIDPESSEQMESALNYCLTNLVDIQRLGKEARLTASNNFNSDNLSKDLLNAFEQISK